MSLNNALPRRLQSIDVLRALTMFLMIFVNDVDGVSKIPAWIKHVDECADGLGFADTIFPCFLFIMGLSIPFALRNRISKGETTAGTFAHILLRSSALIVMGFLHVNMESYSDAALLPEPVWEIIITLGFFLIWLDYPPAATKTRQHFLQGTGIALLLAMALLYKGGTPADPEVLQPYWWGILGLIGWSYLLCAALFLFCKGNLALLLTALMVFLFINLSAHAGWLHPFSGWPIHAWVAHNSAMSCFTMSGIVISLLYTRSAKQQKNYFFPLLITTGILFIAYGFFTRPIDGISKIRETPAWIGICTGIGILMFGLIIYIVDIKGKASWFNIIKPAGTSTLTCYLIPSFLYSIMALLQIDYPDVLNQGIGGMLRSFATAFFIVFLTGWLEKKRLRLKL